MKNTALRAASSRTTSHLSSISKTYSIHIQWSPSDIGIPGNTLADLEAKQGSTLPQTSVPVDLATAKVLIRRTGQEEFQTRYKREPHSATHRTFTGDTNPQAHWRFGWTRSQCITVAQLRMDHSPLLASYLHRIGQQQSPVCPYCGGDDETAQHLLLCCPSHASAHTSTNYINSTDPRRMWSFLESIGALTRPLTGNEREREGTTSLAVMEWTTKIKLSIFYGFQHKCGMYQHCLSLSYQIRMITQFGQRDPWQVLGIPEVDG